MDFGVVLQTTPPSARVVDLAKRAETYGFSHVWTFDSHILWQEPYVIYSQILAETRNVIVGPMVTNPATRDWTVTASLYATLNEMYGNRTVCGIGRGDSAVRVTNGAPTTLATLRESVHVIRELANGRSVDYKGSRAALPVGERAAGSRCGSPRYGPKALALTGEVGDGFILQLADLSIAEWTIKAVRDAAAGGRARSRRRHHLRRCAGLRHRRLGRDLAHARDQCRWFGGMVGNHVADIVARYGDDSGAVPQALTDYIKGRQGYDYNEHGQAGNAHTQFVPDEIVDRFCIVGPVERAHRAAGRAQGARRRPVRHLPPARRQGRHAAGATARRSCRPSPKRSRPRRDTDRLGDNHRRASAQLDRCSRSPFVFVVAIWEGYKAVGPADGGRLLGVRLLPRTNDRAMPHVWEMVSRARPAGGPRQQADDPQRRARRQRGTRSGSRCVGVRASGRSLGIAVAVLMARFKLVERGLMPYLSCRRPCRSSSLGPLIVSWTAYNSRGLVAKTVDRRPRCSACSSPSSPSPSATLRGLQSTPPAVDRADGLAGIAVVAHACSSCASRRPCRTSSPALRAGGRRCGGRRRRRRDLDRDPCRGRQADPVVRPRGDERPGEACTPPSSVQPRSGW